MTEPRTEAGRILLREHSSGTPHMARHILAIEAEAAAGPRDEGLDVERLARAIAKHHRRSYVDMVDTLAAKDIARKYAALAKASE